MTLFDKLFKRETSTDTTNAVETNDADNQNSNDFGSEEFILAFAGEQNEPVFPRDYITNLFKEYITQSIFSKPNQTEFTVGYRSDYVYYYKICIGKPFIIFDKPHFPTPVVFPCILKKEEFIKHYPNVNIRSFNDTLKPYIGFEKGYEVYVNTCDGNKYKGEIVGVYGIGEETIENENLSLRFEIKHKFDNNTYIENFDSLSLE